MTIYTIDAPPVPSDFELEALDRDAWARRERLGVTPHTKCCFNYYVRLRNINGERPYFHEFVTEQGRAGAVMPIAQWDVLRAIFEVHDERDTLMGARYAGCR